jgi:hypothetical protein
MYNGDPGEDNPDTSSPVGSSKAFVVKLKSETEYPDCISTCNGSRQIVAADVKPGHCYIDRYCYADQDTAPYAGAGCMICKADEAQLAWSGPVGMGTSHCYIDDVCYADGDHKQVSAGRSTVDSECETCQPAKNTAGFELLTGYAMVDGACHKKTWEEEATAAGWNPPCEDGGARLRKARRDRRLSLSSTAKNMLRHGGATPHQPLDDD